LDLKDLPSRLVLDGGIGTSLIARGLDVENEPTALWNLTHPEEVQSMHESFLRVGSGAIQTNTFVANRLSLMASGVEDVRGCNLSGVALAHQAVAAAGNESTLVIGSIGPTGQVPPPQGEANLHDLEHAFAEQAALLVEGGVHFLHVETMAHPKEMRAALRGIREATPSTPVVVSIACRKSGLEYKTTMGFAVESMISVAIEEKAEGLGANCMLSPADMLPLIEMMLKKVDVPIFAQPTIAPDGEAPLYPDEFAEGVRHLFNAGARAVGGCCGTSPKDIETAVRRMK
jgi:5-methyltetrahydrofolate--homocysteine methyltransferase